MNRSSENKMHERLRLRSDELHAPLRRRSRSAFSTLRKSVASASLCISLYGQPSASALQGAEIHVAPTNLASLDVVSTHAAKPVGPTGSPSIAASVPHQQAAWQLTVFAARAGQVVWSCTPFFAADDRRSTRDAEITVRLVAAGGIACRGGSFSARTDVAAGRESAAVSLFLEGHGTGLALVSVTMLGHSDEIAADRYTTEITARSTAH